MRITIQNFRIYKEQVTFEFEEGKITLLSGESGKGKSTILQAIYWCLYGSMQHIYPHECNENAKCTVILEFSSIYMKRSKPPSTFIIHHDNKIYENDVAAEFVRKMFGSQNLWKSSSYMVQDERSPLVTLSSTDKFNLLYELTFGEEDEKQEDTPDFYLSRLDEAISKKNNEVILQTGKYQGLSEYINRLENERKEDKILFFTENQEINFCPTKTLKEETNYTEEEVKKKLYRLEQEIKDEKKCKEELENEEKEWNLIYTNLKDKEDKLKEKENINLPSLQTLNLIMEKIEKYEEKQKYINELNKLFYIEDKNDLNEKDLNRLFLILSQFNEILENLSIKELVKKGEEIMIMNNSYNEEMKRREEIIRQEEIEYKTYEATYTAALSSYNLYLERKNNYILYKNNKVLYENLIKEEKRREKKTELKKKKKIWSNYIKELTIWQNIQKDKEKLTELKNEKERMENNIENMKKRDEFLLYKKENDEYNEYLQLLKYKEIYDCIL
jgi:DNA repair exonuclease SbcCD ATPase subunit